MTRTISNRSRLIETSVALSLVATLALIGCGTDMSTAPNYVAIENDDGASEGELPVPTRQRVKVPTPASLTLVKISANGATISWSTSLDGLTAHIELNGIQIASVNASDQRFTDTMAKRPGLHTYGVCFENGSGKLSRMAYVEGELLDIPAGNRRTDDRPEDGR